MNSQYSMLIQWSDEDQAYIVTLPEFPTCHTHGETYEEAVKNGEEVLKLIAEAYQERGEPLPAPVKFQYA
jgi:predicted RNase H-like HicB family nuclease